VAVKIRMKMMGRKHRAYFRICATDSRAPRDGRVLEDLGTYDPSIKDTDARASFNQDRLAYWLSVGATPSERVSTLIKKYGPNGSHIDLQKQAQEKLKAPRAIPEPGEPKFVPGQKEAAAAAVAEAAAAEASATEATAESSEAPAAEAAASESGEAS